MRARQRRTLRYSPAIYVTPIYHRHSYLPEKKGKKFYPVKEKTQKGQECWHTRACKMQNTFFPASLLIDAGVGRPINGVRDFFFNLPYISENRRGRVL